MTKKWHRYLSIAFIGLLISSLIVSTISNTVSAVSVYDELIEGTSTISLDNATCSPLDITTQWLAIIQDDTVWEASYGGAADPHEFREEAQAQIAGINQDMAYVIHQTQNGDTRTVTVWYGMTYTEWEASWINIAGVQSVNPNPTGTNENGEGVYFELSLGSDCTERISLSGTGYSSATFGMKGTGVTAELKQFLVNLEPNYPTGYEGAEFQESVNTQINVTPKFHWLVQDKRLKASPLTSLQQIVQELGTPLYPNTGYLTYEIYECVDDSYVDCNDLVYSQEKLIETSEMQYDFDEYGYYRLHIRYDLPSIVPPPVPPSGIEYTYYPKWVNLNVNGTSYTGTSQDPNCTGTICDEATQYEDCSEFAGEAPWGFGGGAFPDLFGLIGCNTKNFFTSLKAFVVSMIGPITYGSNSSPFLQFQSSNHGVADIVLLPIEILGNISTSYYTCTPFTLPLPYVTNDINIPCLTPLYETHFTGYFTIYQTITGGIISYYSIVSIFEVVKRAKDPNDDKIEVTKL